MRSDGTYPPFRRFEVSMDEEPEGWKKGARRCMVCDKLWPNHDAFQYGPCCGEETAIAKRVRDPNLPGAMMDAKPGLSWKDSLKELFQYRFAMFYTAWNEGISDEELYYTPTEPVDEDVLRQLVRELDDLPLT